MHPKLVLLAVTLCAVSCMAFSKLDEIHKVHDEQGTPYYLVPVDLIQRTRYSRNANILDLVENKDYKPDAANANAEEPPNEQ